MNNKDCIIGIPEILKCQKNRYPMMFIDQVTECIPGKYAKGFKLFSYNEWFFHGYETKSPKVWNVIQIEAMSQMFLMTFLSIEEFRGSVAVSNKFDNVQFLKRISPGDRLELEATLESFGRGVARGKVKGFVMEGLACSMDCTIVIPSLMPPIQDKMDKSRLNIEKKEKVNYLKEEFGIDKIKECLLNKYPWLFIDKVLAIEPGKFVEAIKNFTYNEMFFPEHFPGLPSVPGFIQIESCMQAFLLSFLSLNEYKRRETADRLLKNVRVQRKIIPGEVLVIQARLESFSRGIAKGKVQSFVNNEPAVSFEVVAVVLDELEKFKPKQ